LEASESPALVHVGGVEPASVEQFATNIDVSTIEPTPITTDVAFLHFGQRFLN
jgi:hypothetical protein